VIERVVERPRPQAESLEVRRKCVADGQRLVQCVDPAELRSWLYEHPEAHQSRGAEMAQVTTELSMSLDGFIAHSDDSVDHLFDWYFNGTVDVPTADPRLVFHTSEASARHIREGFSKCGCLVTGRRLFDLH
jgi:hypothetical protein